MPQHTRESMIQDRLPTLKPVRLLAIICVLTVLGLTYYISVDYPLSFIPADSSPIPYVESRQHERLNQQPIDLLLLGSSRIGFNLSGTIVKSTLPQVVKTTANFGFPSFRPASFRQIIQRNESTLAHSKLWIIGLDDYYVWSKKTYADYSKLSLAQWMDQYLYDNLRVVKVTKEKAEYSLLHLKVFLRYLPSSFAGWPLSKEMDKWIYSGLENRIVDPAKEPTMFTDLLDSNFKHLTHSPRQEHAMIDVLDFAQSHNIRVVFLVPPNHPQYMTLLKNNPDYLAKTLYNRAFFDRLASKYHIETIRCQDKRDNCGVSPQDFADPVHLNHQGSIRFSGTIAKRLQQLIPQPSK